MLLMVDLSLSTNQLAGFSGTFQLYLLDFSAMPAKWVKMEKLENQALFVSLDRSNPTFSCMFPERWGGKSNYIYVAKRLDDSDEPWTAVEVGQPMASATNCVSYGVVNPPELNTSCSHLESLWVLPNFVYGVGQ
uniref:Uncharacterized protein n=1 Tax=Avena sativa TaxID=4498 RepID=A0ACD6AD10_AVESA